MAFTGRATYDNFTVIGEDVSDLVTILAPRYTPLLDVLGTSDQAASNVKHEWIEDSLRAYTTTMSSGVASDAGAAIGIEPASITMFRVGDIARISASGNSIYNEVVEVVSVAAASIYVARARGGTTATSFAAGVSIEVIANAALEGEDTDEDFSQTRVRASNWTQIFKIGVKLSGSQQAVRNLGVPDEMGYQKASRLAECMRELEKAITVGRTLVNTIGSDTARRVLAGMAASISTNVLSNATFTESYMNSCLQLAYNQGSRNINVLLVKPAAKRSMSTWNASRIHIVQDAGNAREDWYRSLVSVYEGDFGVQQVVMSPWLANEGVALLGLDTSLIKVVPLAGRSFAYQELAKTGDSDKGQIVGEYTLEFRTEKAHCKLMGGPY